MIRRFLSWCLSMLEPEEPEKKLHTQEEVEQGHLQELDKELDQLYEKAGMWNHGIDD